MIQLLQLEFVRNALIAGTIVAILSAVVGYFVVLRAQAFATEALSDIGFAGATGAVLLGGSSLLGTFVFTLLAAYGIGVLGERVRGRDLEIGMVLAFALGLGVLFLNLYTQFATETVNILFGSLLSVSLDNVVIIAWVSLAILLIVAFLFRPLLFASIDPEMALARGVPVRLLSIAFMLVLAITVSEAVQIVGVAARLRADRRACCQRRTPDQSSTYHNRAFYCARSDLYLGWVIAGIRGTLARQLLYLRSGRAFLLWLAHSPSCARTKTLQRAATSLYGLPR